MYNLEYNLWEYCKLHPFYGHIIFLAMRHSKILPVTNPSLERSGTLRIPKDIPQLLIPKGIATSLFVTQKTDSGINVKHLEISSKIW